MYVVCLPELRFLVWKSVILRCSAHNLSVWGVLSFDDNIIGGGLETLLCPAPGDWFDLFGWWIVLLLQRVGEETLLLIASLGEVVCLAGLLFVSLSLAKKSFCADETDEALSSFGPKRPRICFVWLLHSLYGWRYLPWLLIYGCFVSTDF